MPRPWEQRGRWPTVVVTCLAVIAVTSPSCGSSESANPDCGFDGTLVHADALVQSIAAVAEVEITNPGTTGGCESATSDVHVIRWQIGGDAAVDLTVAEPGPTRDLASIGQGHRALLLLEDLGAQSNVRWHVQWSLAIDADGTLRSVSADPLGVPLPDLIRQATGGSDQVAAFVDWLRDQQATTG